MAQRLDPPDTVCHMDDTLHRNATRLIQLPICRALSTLSLPIVLSNVLFMSYQLVNTFWVGRLGEEAIAVVSVSFPVIGLLISLGDGLAVAGSTLVAQYAGARDPAMVKHVAGETVLIVVAVAAVSSAIGFVMVRPILDAMGIRPDILEESSRYMRVSFLGIVFMFAFGMFESILRGIGQVRVPLYVIAFSVVLNLILDPALIFGWGPIPAGGVVGAAYATLVTQGLAAAVGCWILFGRRHGVNLRLIDFVPDIPLIRRVFLLGVPASIEQSMNALGITVMTVMASSFGTGSIAAYGIGLRVLIFVIIPAHGISMATSTLVGQNIGAGNLARAKETATVSAWFSFWLLTGAAVIVFAGAETIVRFFVPHDPELIRQGATVVRYIAVSFSFIGVQLSLTGTLRGAGDMLMPMLLTAIDVWVIQIPVAYLLAYHTALGETGL